MKLLLKFLATIILVVFVAVGFAWSGLYNVAASKPHTGFTHWLLSITSRASIERHARDIEAPDLNIETLVLAGVNDFDSMCSACHGAPGKKPEALGKGLYPLPPDLAKSATYMTPEELYWVTRNGIKLTGMPAWGSTHQDEELWPVVAFMMRLPDLDAGEYQALLDRAKGHGHHNSNSAMHAEDHAPSDGAKDIKAETATHSHGDSDEAAEQSPAHDHEDSAATEGEEQGQAKEAEPPHTHSHESEH
jgi:mono/diheme cytochrome c family protein